ncbi:site-specific integrase [Bifidobacterium thermacidophilum]|uniref:Site-specific recombinase, phage integrase family n=1 Tax=Bifidobacterium thermacidophilum subsp. thermacidophilum TaxID=79262 RepID=A0A087E4H8_9BIFI|nr:tyrosine-type recombinase/integrase [Bifidobacterium thermacidophilum]KFJ02679.1 site-specific recombinase, phage integrase family [Bifidobacterium thermacidophilum subsp. thermacidophilum]
MAKRRTQGSGSVFKDANGVWHYRKDLGRDPATGRRRTVGAKGRTKADARARFNAKLAELERTGLLPGGKSPELADYTERWLADYRTRVKPTTYRTREGRLKACNEVIGHVRLKDLTPEHIRRCMRVLGERLAPSTLKDHFVSLKMVLDQAELEELIPVDPCRRVKPPRVERRVVDVLGPEQPRRMIEAASSMPLARRGARPAEEDLEMWALLFEVAFETGMREGERYAIMPFELELRDGQPGIHVRQQIQRYGRPGEVEIPNWLEATHLSGTLWLTTPKTPAAERFVPVSGSLWERLWKRIRDNGIGSRELVFTSARGNPVCSSTERYQWCKALKAAGLPQVKIHSARHWMATMAARANMPDDARIAVMGHTSMQMTMRYTHRDAASLGQLMAAAIPDLGGNEIVEAEVVD